MQVKIDVLDSAYKGYLPNGLRDFSPGQNQTITYQGGPVESTTWATGTSHPPEYLSTVRLNTLAEAQAILATVASGKQVTLSRTKDSQIVVPADVSKTFQKA